MSQETRPAGVDPELLKILVCPETKQALKPAEPALIERLNRSVREGGLKNRGAQQVSRPLDAGLVRSDGKYLYPVRDGIPIMLIDEAIAL